MNQQTLSPNPIGPGLPSALDLPPVDPTLNAIGTAGEIGAVPARVQSAPAANDQSSSGNTRATVPDTSPGVSGVPEPEKPIIHVSPGSINQNVNDAEKCLAATGKYYQRSGQIVTARTDPSSKETFIQPVSRITLVRELDGQAVWLRLNAKSGEWVRISPTDVICRTLVEGGDYKHLPVLNGLARQPHMRSDGTLCLTSGYDAATGLLGVFDGGDYDVPAEPTRAEAMKALAVLDDVLREFAFSNDSDRSAALSAMLTAAIRPSLCLAPMFHVRAPEIGSGKSYLCELITVFATAYPGARVAFPGGNDECGKLLLAELLKSPAVIEFDNLTGDILPFKSLCTALTSEHMTGRILGVSKTAAVSTRTLVLCSGNNVGPAKDMTRRCITIRLDPACEMPVGRRFSRPDLLAEVRKDRGRYVSAAFTIVRAWAAAGEPPVKCEPLASFGDWSAWCRQPLLWLGRKDPAISVFEGMAEDPDRETLGRLLVALRGEFGGKPVMVKQMMARASSCKPGTEDLLEILQDISGEQNTVNRKRLGQWIYRHAGQIVDGMKLVKSGAKRNAQSWQVVSSGPASSVVSVVSVLPAGSDKSSASAVSDQSVVSDASIHEKGVQDANRSALMAALIEKIAEEHLEEIAEEHIEEVDQGYRATEDDDLDDLLEEVALDE
jgi:hypothetical protein